MREQRQMMEGKFVLPSGVVTSNQEMRGLQQKLLKKHYQDLPLKPHQGQSPVVAARQLHRQNSQISRQASEHDKYLQDYDYRAKEASKEMKQALSNDLKLQMEHKNIKKQFDRQIEKTQDGRLLKHAPSFEALERQKERRFLEKYRQEAKEEIEVRQSNKMRESRANANEKQHYRNKFSEPFIGRSQSVGEIRHYQPYDPTKEYYREIDQAMRGRSRVSLNPEGIAYNSSFKITHSPERVQQIDGLYQSSINRQYQRQQGTLLHMKEQQTRQRDDLKNALLEQIKEKRQAREGEKRYHRQIPYRSGEFEQRHHPINNPIDFRYAHDNKYFMGQLRSVDQ